MSANTKNTLSNPKSTKLVLGATGKTGRRVVDRLKALGHEVRLGSRSATPSFDWEKEETYAPVLRGVDAVYITYFPDVAVPGATDKIRTLSKIAVENGVRRLVLLSGRGEHEAEECEKIVQQSGAEWTILRCNWFMQNFSEAYMLDAVLAGEVAMPAGDQPEPFVDCDDIADVAVAALIDDKHANQLYTLSGPRTLTFAQAVGEIAKASGREVRYIPITHKEYEDYMRAAQVPPDIIWLVSYLFTEVLDGRNESLTDGVQRALGRKPKDFADYAREAAATGVWTPKA
jgi:uncharacterized protein YbjT (DUF2867 family)